MGTGAGRYVGQAVDNTNPLRRDTVVIPAYSYLILRFVTDNREYSRFSILQRSYLPEQLVSGHSIAIWRGTWPQVSLCSSTVCHRNLRSSTSRQLLSTSVHLDSHRSLDGLLDELSIYVPHFGHYFLCSKQNSCC
jgi:hypothetical protein